VLPRPSDLSFYNWDTQTSTSNSSPNFQVIADNEAGLLFKNKRDRKVRCAERGAAGHGSQLQHVWNRHRKLPLVASPLRVSDSIATGVSRFLSQLAGNKR